MDRQISLDENYLLVMTNIDIENSHLQLIYPLEMLIFHSHVKLPVLPKAIGIKWSTDIVRIYTSKADTIKTVEAL